MPNKIQVIHGLEITLLNSEQMISEISERLKCARLWCRRHWVHLCDPNLQCKIKFQLYKQFVRPIITYGCEVWVLNERSCKKLIRFECAVLLEIYKSKYPRRHPKRLRPNIREVYCQYRDTDVVDHIRRQRLKWNQLLQYEERVFRRAKREQRIRWWDQHKR